MDKIDGLSPVIAIEQKTTTKSPRSTVGTITEIYDFLRLYIVLELVQPTVIKTNEKMISYSDDQIRQIIQNHSKIKSFHLEAPVIRSRKGHYRELFEQIGKQGFVKVRIDGVIENIIPGMRLDRYKNHDIEIVIDRIKIDEKTVNSKRLQDSITTAMNQGDNVIMVPENNEKPRFFSRNLMCPSSGISYPNPEPNNFSFNSPKGACNDCNGIGNLYKVNEDKIIPDRKISIQNGGLAPQGSKKNSWIFKQLEIISKRHDFSLSDPISEIPEDALKIILYGGKDKFSVKSKSLGVSRDYLIDFDGIANFIEHQYITIRSQLA